MRSAVKSASVIAVSLLLSACIDDINPNSSSSSSSSSNERTGIQSVEHDGLDREDIDGVISSHDGTDIAYTVFLPDLDENEGAPIVFHSHGWGGSRLTELSASGGEDEFIGDAPAEAAFLAREHGAIVVSFDQRGFGDSGGQAELMDPELEGRDFIALLDEIDALYEPFVLRTADGNPRVGTLGLSYGGGYQWVAGSVDDRVDAMVPVGTWYDLSYSLHSGDTPKTTWIALLLALGIPGAEGALAEDLYLNAGRILLPGVDVDDDFLDRISGHGIRRFCEGTAETSGSVPAADVLIMQGVEDTLFNMNEALDAYDCLRERTNGGDAHLFVQRTGHVAPIVEQSPGPFGFGMERTMECGGEIFQTSQLMFEFLDSRLRDDAASLVLPSTCLTVADRDGILDQNIERGGTAFTLDNTQINPLDDALSSLLAPPDFGGFEDFLNVTADYLERLSPSTEVEIFTAQQNKSMAGIPRLNLHVSASVLDPTLFVGLRIAPEDGSSPTLIHNQVVPIAGIGEQEVELAGVTVPVNAGDRVSLAFYSAHPLYIYNEEAIASTLNLINLEDMMVRLPLN